MGKRLSVLLVTEGTYPYNTGGVSTWAHDLCTKIPEVDYTLYSINALVEHRFKYQLSGNVQKIVQVPMWSSEEPIDCIDYGREYFTILKTREITSEAAIKASFAPFFKKFIEIIYSEHQSVEELDACFFSMWKFFNLHDYKTTMASETVWNTFCDTLKSVLPNKELVHVPIGDITTAMRWIYRFLIPISIEVPKVDISHVTISGVAVLPALCLKYQYDTPILLTEHGVYIRERMIAISAADYSFFLKKMLINFSECITKLAYFKASKITTVSKFNVAWEKFYGADYSKIEVIYNGVDSSFFKPRKKPDHLQDTPTVVAAARIFELKDILTMIRVCKVVCETLPKTQFLIYGNKDAVPEYTAECESLITELGLKNNFFLKGFHEKPEELYAEGDISILTSISEGFPFTVIESMSCEVPVVATDVGGVSEALDDACGFVCKPKDANEIAEKVVKLLVNKELRTWMGENARRKVLENFTTNLFTDAFKRVYAELSVSPAARSKVVFIKESI
ncbi:GT4 family glycosyltransferase PelF [Arenibacter palladensis]|uniref:GT4 family glycosyltransferase PelF n=1 Tax=Arenibacter palladensis TaxID=237373 RepID=UPI0026E137AF|nr:GT4 family glycosyltransferase PelF [Arenibacter palladensis]MDO6604156.1 GT4 family glycosyltransferase PelF [Arenibacter palladensis]